MASAKHTVRGTANRAAYYDNKRIAAGDKVTLYIDGKAPSWLDVEQKPAEKAPAKTTKKAPAKKIEDDEFA